MADRALVLVAAAALGLLLLGAYGIYRRRAPGPERLDVGDLGLELMSGCCAFVVFTSPTCAPCKTALRIVQEAAGSSNGLTEVTSVDAHARADLALRYEVRTVPTVFLITASGHVIERWRDVPDPPSVEAALAQL